MGWDGTGWDETKMGAGVRVSRYVCMYVRMPVCKKAGRYSVRWFNSVTGTVIQITNQIWMDELRTGPAKVICMSYRYGT